MKVVYCGGLDWVPTAPDHLGIKQGMTELGWDWKVVDPILNDPTGQQVAKEINEFNPELVIHGNADSLILHVCRHVDMHIPQVFWMLDYRTPEMLEEGMWKSWAKNAPYLDAIFISAKGHMQLWRSAFGLPVYFAPHACWVPPETSGYREEMDHDLLFIGVCHDQSPFNARTNLLAEIGKEVPISYVNSSDWTKRNQIWTDMPAYYHSSKVVLDVSHFWDNDGYCSGRYWYTATLGACAVTKRFPGCEEFFKDKDHKWYFDTPAEAVELIKRLLEDQELREKTKKQVKVHAWSAHTYAIRFREMLECL
jgi:hypothetical protein